MISTCYRMLLRPRKKGYQNPLLMSGQPEAPETLANPNKQIPYLAGLNIKLSLPCPGLLPNDQRHLRQQDVMKASPI
jgi:hypothetical protein